MLASPRTPSRPSRRRRAQIEEALEKRGPWSRASAEVAALSTRASKAAVPALDELRQRWQAQAAELGLGPGFVGSLTHQMLQPDPDLALLVEDLVSPGGLTAHASTFDRRAVLQELAAAHQDGSPITALRSSADELLYRDDVVALGPGTNGEQIYTTSELWPWRRLVGRASGNWRPLPSGPWSAKSSRPTLSEEQRHMVSTLVTSGAPTQVVVGRAGAGKTFALDAARMAWESAGHRVIGTALAARAAAELQSGAGIPSTTLDRLLGDLERPGPLPGLAPRTTIVVDEAGMVETRKLARLLDHAERWQAQVVLVGDPRQLPEVGAGGAFRALARQLPVIELADNRRQAEAWEREALAELRSGSVATAVSAYERAGRVTLAPDAESAREALVDAWWTSFRSGEHAMMYALRRTDVDDLNKRARAHMAAAGLLGDEHLVVAGREFAPGDRVMCLRNDRRLGVANGTTGTVTSVAGGEVALADGTRLPPSVPSGRAPHPLVREHCPQGPRRHGRPGVPIGFGPALPRSRLRRALPCAPVERAIRRLTRSGQEDGEPSRRPRSRPAVLPRPVPRHGPRTCRNSCRAAKPSRCGKTRTAGGPADMGGRSSRARATRAFRAPTLGRAGGPPRLLPGTPMALPTRPTPSGPEPRRRCAAPGLGGSPVGSTRKSTFSRDRKGTGNMNLPAIFRKTASPAQRPVVPQAAPGRHIPRLGHERASPCPARPTPACPRPPA